MSRTDSVFITISVLLHMLMFSLLPLGRSALSGTPKLTILAVETIPGGTPLGLGSGAPGQAHRITDKPANLKPNPLSGALKLKTSDLPAPLQPVKKKGGQAPQVSHAPSYAEVAGRDRAAMPKIGVNARGEREGDLSEGGLGDGRKAGTATGDPTITGEIGSWGYRPVDWGFPAQLPEEGKLVITLVVGANGLVRSAILKTASGHPEIDEIAISKARSMVFDPPPSNGDQEDRRGEITFNFSFQSGKE
jgi:TonB family protein